MSKLERSIKIEPAFDKRNDDPAKNYGIHGVEMRFLVKGPEGAVQFLLYTNWQLDYVQADLEARGHASLLKPLPADIGYHSPTPKYEGQTCRENCAFLDGKPCYYDGSALQADEVFKILVEKGDDGLWAYLEDYYRVMLVEGNG